MSKAYPNRQPPARPPQLPRRITIDLNREPMLAVIAPDFLELERLLPIARRLEWLLGRMLARKAAA